MCSGGTYIGYLAAKQLELQYLDREILQQAAKATGIGPQMLEKFDGQSASLLEKIINAFCFGAPEIPSTPIFKEPIYDKDLFNMEAKIIRRIADQCSAVIVGRGGFYILRNRADTINVFIHAPIDYRVERIMKAQKIDKQTAMAMVKKSDHTRTKFIYDMLDVDWTDARNFHLSFDSNVIGVSTSVKMIRKLIKNEN